MAAKPRLRVLADAVSQSLPRFSVRLRSCAIVAIGTAIGLLAFSSAALADTGTVYYDSNSNVAAGKPGALFNGSFTGLGNVGLGYRVMQYLTGGSRNVATGDDALYLNTTGNDNVATGVDALGSNTTGNENVATGTLALEHNTTGADNLASGARALAANTMGNHNVASGDDALTANTSGHDNVADGYQALQANKTGTKNLALGSGAGSKLTTGSNNIDIASPGVAGESGAIRIGTKGTQKRAILQGVSGTSISGPSMVVRVNAAGQLGTATSASPKRGGTSAKAGGPARVPRRFRVELKRQQREIRRQGKELRELRAQR